MSHTIITHLDGAGYCTGIAAFDITPQGEGLYDTYVTRGDRGMCGFQIEHTEFKQLSSEKLGTLVGNHVGYAIFASGMAVTRDWVIRSTALMSRLRDPAVMAAFAAALGQTTAKVNVQRT
jgi:hypothetical protein